MIDWARISELRAEIGDDSFDEVAELFLDEADEAVVRLDAALDAPTLESVLHFLKGSALNLGFRTLATLCQDGERLAGGGSAAVDRSEIKDAYHASKAAFLGDRGSALSA